MSTDRDWESDDYLVKQRLVVGGILLLFGVTLAGGLAISFITVKRGLVIYSDDPQLWQPGHQVTFRIIGYSLPIRLPIELKEASAKVYSATGELLGHEPLKPGLNHMWQGTLTLPEHPGDYELTVQARGWEHPGVSGDEVHRELISLNARSSFRLSDQSSQVSIWPGLSETPKTVAGREGLGTLSFYPAEQRLTTELPSDMFIVAQAPDGRPWQGEVLIQREAGLVGKELPEALFTDRRGLARLPVSPRSLQMSVKVSAEIPDLETPDLPLETTITHERLVPRPHQFNLTASHQLVRAGGLITLLTQSTRVADQLYVDLWSEGRWLLTKLIPLSPVVDKGRRDRLKATGQQKMTVPDLSLNAQSEPRLLWLQSYLVPYQIDEVRGGQYLLYLPKDYSKVEAAQWFRKQLIEAHVEPEGYWSQLSDDDLLSADVLRLALGRLKRPSTNPQLIVDSADSAIAMAERQRGHYFSYFFKMMATLCLTTIGWLLVISWRQYRRTLLAFDWLESQDQSRLRQSILGNLVPMLFVLILFFGAMMLLVTKVSW